MDVNENKDIFTIQKQRKYKSIINPILTELQTALILHKLKTGNNGKTGTSQLSFNENREICESKGKISPTKTAIDISGNIEDINIIDIKKKAYKKIDDAEIIEDKDKDKLKNGIQDFIKKIFYMSRIQLEEKKNLLHKTFRTYYTKYTGNLINNGELSKKEGILYRDICLTIANILYNKNKNYINNDGQINQNGIEYIGRTFLKAIKNIPNLGSSKSFHKIFHDGDFNFLRKENSEGEPKIGTLDHYVRAIMYLMDSNSFNAYEEGGEEGAKEWYKAQKLFLNSLYTTIYLEDENKKGIISDKGIIHKELVNKRQSCKSSLDYKGTNWDLIGRLKTESSKMLKIGGRTTEIKDESGIRATYYGNMEDKTEIKKSILILCKEYFRKISNIRGIHIESIQTDLKGEFISKEIEEEIKNELGNYLSQLKNNIEISERSKNGNKKSKIEKISKTYESLTGAKPNKGLLQAYRIANGGIKRGSNGKYEDFKLIVKYTIDKDEYNQGSDNDQIEENLSLFQEISFYPHDNDLGIGNHNFLDLEKRIFNRVKNMNDPELGKSVSLNRLRYITETAIKDISFDIDIYEDKIERGLLPTPTNDKYKFIELDGKKLPLNGLTYRTQKNSDRFDDLISLILNYFIKSNKIFYINREGDGYNGLITKEQLHDKNAYKSRRFSTPDVLRNISLDTQYSNYTIYFYTHDRKKFGYENFYMVRLGDLGEFTNLEKHI